MANTVTLVARRMNPERPGGDLALPDHEQRAAGAPAADVPGAKQALYQDASVR